MYFKQRIIFKGDKNAKVSYFNQDEEFEVILKPIKIMESPFTPNAFIWFYHLQIKDTMFRFWGSIYNRKENKHHDPIEAFEAILNCAETSIDLEFSEEWCSDMGFDWDSVKGRKRAQKYYDNCETIANKLNDMGILRENLFIYANVIRDRDENAIKIYPTVKYIESTDGTTRDPKLAEYFKPIKKEAERQAQRLYD